MTAIHIGSGIFVEQKQVDTSGRVIVSEFVGYDDEGTPIFCTIEDPPEDEMACSLRNLAWSD